MEENKFVGESEEVEERFFAGKLQDVEQGLHPGTTTPKSFHSDIILYDNQFKFKSTIEMNEPLRYRGFTFYQTGFDDSATIERTVFAVVKNYGQLFPYISSIIMSIGLLIHLLTKLPKLIKRKHNWWIEYSIYW